MIPFELSEPAKADLESIFSYHAYEVGDLDLADRLNEEIFSGIRKLARSPELGHFRTDLAPKPAQFYKVGRYLIVYRVSDELLEIARIIHGSRDFPKTL